MFNGIEDLAVEAEVEVEEVMMVAGDCEGEGEAGRTIAVLGRNETFTTTGK